MNFELNINKELCTECGRCVRVCPSKVFTQQNGNSVEVINKEGCIVCGHCVGACAVGAVEHSEFPSEKVHKIDYSQMPTPEQMMLLCKARRSNRAFSKVPIPGEWLDRIVEAAHRAPTASNMQQVHYTVVIDPEKLKLITDYTLGIFGDALKKLTNPLLKPVIKLAMPGADRYVPLFQRLIAEHKAGNDMVLRGATAVILIHAPKSNRFGSIDANLAYQNGSLMAECLGVSQFYTGFVLSAVIQDKKSSLEKLLGIDESIQAGMALGMPAFHYPNYIDRKGLVVNKI